MLKNEFDPKSVNLNEFEGKFTETAFWEYLKNSAKEIGEKNVFDALKLFYCYKSPATPVLEKSMIAGALGYLVSNFDVIPDEMPVYGLADDEAILSMVIGEVAKYFDDSIETAARQQLSLYF